MLARRARGTGIKALWDKVADLWGDGHAPTVNPIQFAKGGLVPGSGTGGTVPALLTPDEFVLSLDMIRKAGGPGVVEAAFGAGSNDGRHYAGGSWIDSIKHAGSSLGHGIIKGLDALKDLALGGVRDAASLAFKGLNAILAHIPGANVGIGKLMVGGVKSIESHLLDFFGKKDKTAAVAAPGNVSGSLVQWITAAIRATGAPMSWLNGLEVIVMHESGGNPNAINNWDSNAAAGDPSRGLAQVIMSTFMAYHQSGTSSNIYDPVANVAAAINYIKSVYRSINNVPGIRSMAHGGSYVGYESGTWDTGPYPQMALLHPHEAVLPSGQLGGGLGGSQTVVFDFRGTQVMSDRDINLLVDKIGKQFVQKVLPQAGVQIQR